MQSFNDNLFKSVWCYRLLKIYILICLPVKKLFFLVRSVNEMVFSDWSFFSLLIVDILLFLKNEHASHMCNQSLLLHQYGFKWSWFFKLQAKYRKIRPNWLLLEKSCFNILAFTKVWNKTKKNLFFFGFLENNATLRQYFEVILFYHCMQHSMDILTLFYSFHKFSFSKLFSEDKTWVFLTFP